MLAAEHRLKEYTLAEVTLNKIVRPSLREQIDDLREQIRRIEESLQDARDRLGRHDIRITSLQEEIGE